MGRPLRHPHPTQRRIDVLLPKLARDLRATALPPVLRDGIPLTDREIDVLLASREGLTNKAIGRRLGISPRTVEIYKRDARNRFEGVSIIMLILMLDRLLAAKEL